MTKRFAALALITLAVFCAAPAQSHGGWATWKCTADGIRYSSTAPAPQRVPFTASGQRRESAVQAAMAACTASRKVRAGSCKLATCWAA